MPSGTLVRPLRDRHLFRTRRIGPRLRHDRDGQRFIMIENAEPDPSPTELIVVGNWGEELKRLVGTDN